jgi:hypothetical protein
LLPALVRKMTGSFHLRSRTTFITAQSAALDLSQSAGASNSFRCIAKPLPLIHAHPSCVPTKNASGVPTARLLFLMITHSSIILPHFLLCRHILFLLVTPKASSA